MSRRRSRTSFSHALRDIVRATEDLVDDALDRAGEFECGLRKSVSRALDDDDYDDHRRRDDYDDRCDRDDYDCDDHDNDDWDRHRDRRRRGGQGRRGGRPRRRLGPDEGEPYASGPPPGSRPRSDDHPDRDPDELMALKDQLELLRGRVNRRWGEDDHPGGRGRVPRARETEDADSLRDELARLAGRIDRVRDGR